jgi:hypothetical protein
MENRRKDHDEEGREAIAPSSSLVPAIPPSSRFPLFLLTVFHLLCAVYTKLSSEGKSGLMLIFVGRFKVGHWSAENALR